MIDLGYETGTGKPVDVPLAHMAVTGMTQQSGKTTTMEALIDRGDLRAVVFVTKPGEKSFSEGRRILPYFRERADWEYVKELLETRRNESLSKWDGYLMRVCARAKTLNDVRRNVENELPKKRGQRPSHYEVLAGYLDLIIPELERVPYTDKLVLEKGVNIMDLTGMSDEMQAMVLRSTIERIHKSEKNTVLVLPEAWKFIPEGGRSAVFQALHALIREGATNRNYVWVDAQDIAVVSKKILKSVSVWILGKQQEANEVARTINYLIEPIHIRPDMIKTLGIGQFLICAGGAARKVYVRPKWLGELDAVAIAKGEESIETARRIYEEKRRQLAAEAAVRARPRQFSKDEVADLRAGAMAAMPAIPMPGDPPPLPMVRRSQPTAGEGGPPQMLQILDQERPSDDANKNESGTTAGIQRSAGKAVRAGAAVELAGIRDTEENPRTAETETPDTRAGRISEDETMWKERFEALQADHQTLIEAHDAMAARLRKLEGKRTGLDDGPDLRPPAAPASRNGFAAAGALTLDEIYMAMRARAETDPVLLRVMMAQPEIEVRVKPQVLEVNDTDVNGAIALLIHEGFFNEPRKGNDVCKELIDRRHGTFARATVYNGVSDVTRMGFLVCGTDKTYRATGRKVTVKR
jgi:hypothetical protein